MNTVNVSADLSYQVDDQASFALSIVAARTPRQVVTTERIHVHPEVDLELVPYGSGANQLLRFDAPRGVLRVSYEATVSLNGDSADPAELAEMPFAQIPAEVMPYLNPSRYCESDKLGRFAMRLFGDEDSGHARVQAITNWVHDHLEYEAGSTDGSSSATDVLLQRSGVCRDFAHVSIALCRALGIPARYVSGYGLGVEPQDFHGFFEAYVGADWFLFDPTGMAAINGLVRIGSGRDAADAPFATFVGDAQLLSKDITVASVGRTDVEPEAAATA